MKPGPWIDHKPKWANLSGKGGGNELLEWMQGFLPLRGTLERKVELLNARAEQYLRQSSFGMLNRLRP